MFSVNQQSQYQASLKNAYFQLISRYETVIEQFNQNAVPISSRSNNNHTGNMRERETRVRLPKIDLAVFSGSYEYSYQDIFKKLIHLNENLTKIEKFHYLRSSLKDKAAEII
ncbi:hypothetical protein ALC56_03611 [Trachymyrmex septentrionalis]|uniref:Uncharacterized protein n=1 Tax=Trachymyrmex septentrionalis TaxID=34720 RepID=A0A151K3N3_9HYME|nr:hypothetical protein ALC56_03611 [Trachymyrmex septentrionalis]